MTKKTKKLNSMRILEQHNIPYEALNYSTDTRDAEEVAEQIGAPYHLVFKTLVVQSVKGGKPFLAIIPSEQQLNLKKMAGASGEKKVQLVAHKDAELLTGLQVGGISALALMHKNWVVYLHSSATDYEHILMSAGERGTQLRVPTNQFIRLIGAHIADICGNDD